MTLKYHVMVCIPNMGYVTSETSQSLALMFAHFYLNLLPGCKNFQEQKVTLMMANSSMLCTNREKMVMKTLEVGATHILFLDSDMKFPMNTIHRLVGRNKEFIAANCTTRAYPCLPIAHDINGKRISSKNRSGVEAVQHVGLAVSLTKTSAIKKLKSAPLFLMDWVPTLHTYCGEDVYFCQKLEEAGVKIHVDHDISKEIQHIGKHAFGYNDVDEGSFEG